MVEEKLFSAMVNAEQRGVYYIAARYARIYAKFIGVDNLQQMPLKANTKNEFIDIWLKDYFDTLDKLGETIKKVLIEVREKYGKKGKTGIPETRGSTS